MSQAEASKLSAEEVVVGPPASRIARLTEVRGVFIVASLEALAENGHSARYFAALPPAHREPVRSIIASSWVPERLAYAHYTACEALSLSSAEIFANGAKAGTRIRATFMGTVLTVARAGGTTPWIFFERLPGLFARICVGGAVAVYKLGPKEARVEWYGLPGLAIPYFRTSFSGAHQSIIELFCSKAYVKETLAVRGGDWAFRASWV